MAVFLIALGPSHETLLNLPDGEQLKSRDVSSVASPHLAD